MNISNESIQSFYRDYGINDDLVIYKGRFCIYSNYTIKCDGVLSYKITDPVNILFTGSVYKAEEFEQLSEPLKYDNVSIEILGYKIMDGQISNFTNGKIQGFVNDHIIRSKDASVDYIQFDVVNMDKIPGKLVNYEDVVYAGRIKFSVNDYDIVMDKSYDYNKYRARELISRSGSIITHTGRIYKKDKSPFKTKNVDKILGRVAAALSFSCGRYVNIPNAFGFKDEKQVYRSWYRMDSTNFNFVFKWTTTISNYHNFEKYLSLMCKKLEDDYYSNIILSLLDWYIEAINGINLANNIISIQTALEMLSYIILVEVEQIYGQSEYDLHPSQQNIRKLLNICRIDCHIPVVDGFSNDIFENFTDSVDLITYYRNIVVHPSKKKRKIELDFEEMWNTILLGINYIELVVLYLIGYRGEYTNRFKGISFGDVENVPWTLK